MLNIRSCTVDELEVYIQKTCKKNAVFHIPHGPAETFCILMHALSETVRSREWL